RARAGLETHSADHARAGGGGRMNRKNAGTAAQETCPERSRAERGGVEWGCPVERSSTTCFLFTISLLVVGALGVGLQAQTAAPKPEEAKPKADIIFMHANIYTGVPANTPFSSILREEAIAVRGDRIQAVGKTFDLMKLKGPDTQVIDLGGHFVMPGFNDAHLHLADAGQQKLGVDF